jgi:type II secretory pathway predicted ATPase ExeA
MDWATFGLTRRPFRPTPDTAAYVPTAAHDAAFVAVMRAFADGDAAAVVRGEPGTGKTLLGLRVLEAIPADTKRVILHAPPDTRAVDLLQAVLFDLGQPYQGLSEQELRLAVHGELLNGLAAGRRVVLLVDEAHHLTAEAGEELRLLGNLESRDTKAVFAVLLGLPGEERLTAAFRQRVAVRKALVSLDRDEAIRFVRHQLRECGGRPEWLIDNEALHLLADHTGGVPRVLNRATALAFEVAASAGQKAADVEAVLDALEQLGLVTAEALAPAVLPLVPPVEPKPQPKKTTKRKTA